MTGELQAALSAPTVHGPGVAELESLVLTGVAVLLAVVLARLGIALLLALAARRLADRRGAQTLARSALRVSPRLSRGAVALVLGAGVALAPAAAHATDHPAPARAGLPALDRTVAASAPVPFTLPAPAHTAPVAPAALRQVRSRTVTVRRGDSLWSIAARAIGASARPEEIARSWPRWHARNRDTIGPDPTLLRPGQRLVPPRASTVDGSTR